MDIFWDQCTKEIKTIFFYMSDKSKVRNLNKEQDNSQWKCPRFLFSKQIQSEWLYLVMEKRNRSVRILWSWNVYEGIFTLTYVYFLSKSIYRKPTFVGQSILWKQGWHNWSFYKSSGCNWYGFLHLDCCEFSLNKLSAKHYKF